MIAGYPQFAQTDAIFDDPVYLAEMERFLMTAAPR